MEGHPRPWRLAGAVALAALALPGAAAAVSAREVPGALQRLTPEQVSARVEVRDDPLEDHVAFSTKPVHRRGGVVDGVAVSDGYLVALKPRAGGEVRWRIRHDLSYAGPRRDVVKVHVRGANGLLKIAPSAVRRWEDGCPDGLATCAHHLSVEFEAPEHVVREIAAAYSPGAAVPVPVRFKDAHGQDVTVGLAPTEVAGLVRAVDGWRR
jgi:hypothetical protein